MSYHRRATPRAEAEEGIYACWSCDGPGDVSRVRNLNMGGAFVETALRIDIGSSVELYFLTREAEIRASAVVQHVEPGHGLGLKFTRLDDRDRLRFGALMKRVYSAQYAAAI